MPVYQFSYGLSSQKAPSTLQHRLLCAYWGVDDRDSLAKLSTAESSPLRSSRALGPMWRPALQDCQDSALASAGLPGRPGMPRLAGPRCLLLVGARSGYAWGEIDLGGPPTDPIP